MATTVRSLFFAATAAVFMSLSGCGGGGEESSPPVPPFQASQAVKSDTLMQKASARPRALAVRGGEQSGFRVTGAFTPSQEKAKAASAAAVFPAEFSNAVLMDWAQLVYPELFSGTPVIYEDVLAPDNNRYYARYYAATQNYVGICLDVPGNTCEKNGVYGLGPYTGNTMAYFGHRDTYRCLIEEAKYCRPYVQTFSPKEITNVPVKGALAVAGFTYNEPINCSGVGGTSEVGDKDGLKVEISVSCNATTKTVSVTPKDHWPYGSQVCLTLSGIPNALGFGSLPETLCFTTARPAVTKPEVYVGNFWPEPMTGLRAAAVINSTGGVTPIDFLNPPGGVLTVVRAVSVDEFSGQAWFGAFATRSVYAVDLESKKVSAIAIDPSRPEYNHGIQGLALTDTELCYALDLRGVEAYYLKNVLQCRGKMTRKASFTSPVNWLGASTDVVMQLRYLPYGNDKKLYALVTPLAALFDENLLPWGFREGFKPGYKGQVVEIDAATKEVTGRFAVGSVPQDIARDPVTGDLYVVNTGDRSLSIIAYGSRQVRTALLATFTGLEQPRRIIIDRPRGRFYVSDDVGDFVEMGRVVVYSLPKASDPSTIELVARVPVRRMPIGMTPVKNLLYVTSSWEGSVDVVDLDKLSVVQTITGVGTGPEGVAAYVP